VRFKDLGSYLIIPSRAEEPEHFTYNLRQLEWRFLAVRWIWVPFLFIAAWAIHPEEAGWMMIIGGFVAFCNTIASIYNSRVNNPRYQNILGFVMFVLDTMLAFSVIILFTSNAYTAAYASFVYVIVEAAVRYGMTGSLSMIAVFALVLFGIYEYRLAVHEEPFDISAYAFWTVLMTILAVSIGIVIHEGRRQRWRGEEYKKESTLLLERHRISRELHDNVLKTLQGLSLEARALENRTETTNPSVKETAQYIEEVCARTSQEIREVILDLRTEDKPTGIASKISKIVNEWSTAAGITAEITKSGQDIVFPSEPARHLRNIVSEALNNIRRHASASLVKIAVDISADTLDIEINDNGTGIGQSIGDFHTFVARGKLGIAGMKERSELLGGRFSLSSDQSGTVIRLSIPVSQKIRTDS